MNAREVMHSSSHHDWCTPSYFIDLVREVGPVRYDPATSEGNPVDATHFSTPRGSHHERGEYVGVCGLSVDWKWMSSGGLLFCNPRYGRHLTGDVNPHAEVRFKKRVVGTGRGWALKMAHFYGEAIYLVPARTETKWWHSLLATSDASLLWSSPTLGSRVHFELPDGTKPKGGAAFPSSVFYRGPNVERFREVFGPHGELIQRAEAA
ncbi:MAG: hypothetical protein AAGE52_01590 [Myxococcota bacterium]